MLVDEARPLDEDECVPREVRADDAVATPAPGRSRSGSCGPSGGSRSTSTTAASFGYPAELLRVESPSAEVQGHTPSQKVTVPGKRNVGIVELEPVGNYAVRIIFDDGHRPGIYSWPYLYRLGREQARDLACLSRGAGRQRAFARGLMVGGCRRAGGLP